jgi:hypothetical protein
MTSVRQIAANRRNSAKSTGPRTSTGKARSRRNAFAHGLATRFIEDPAASAEIESLAHGLVASGSGLTDLAAARDLVEAQLDVRRVRSCQVELLNISLATTEDETEAIQASLLCLTKIERYARRSHSHLKTTLRNVKLAMIAGGI